jgi:Na+/melibiose symporter-like transporter
MSEEKKYWLDRAENVTLLYRALWVIGIVLLLVDFFPHKHEAFGFAEAFGFYAIYGFVGIVALILGAKALRRAVMRREDYYER